MMTKARDEFLYHINSARICAASAFFFQTQGDGNIKGPLRSLLSNHVRQESTHGARSAFAIGFLEVAFTQTDELRSA
jgi:hypothetical protein